MWTLITCLQEDQAVAVTTIHKYSRGQPPAKRIRRETVRLQERLQALCTRYRAGDIDMVAFLRSVGHIIRLS